ncbi:S8 family serine peptidase [Ornithinimicrobium cavernae]|uniref:S8 family serine peptidase n=1 Tax=Ornithinimicrobium cavernae TaxID=2666047 RepID=UPI000D688DDF|nr:S8 family serine peptidase [Ornithinimicrobium cavernae]
MYRKLLAGASLVAVIAAPAVALAAPPQAQDTDTGTDYAIVTFKDAPLATYAGGTNGIPATRPVHGRLDPSSPAYRAYERFLANEHANYKAFVAQKLPGVEVVGEYDTVLNGVAVKLNGASLTSLSKHAKVASASPSWTYQPTMNVSTDIINAPAVWEQLGGQAGAGEGIDVGIVDSGIRDDHPFFACKDEIPHKTYASGTSGPGIDIVINHGTHVAGTVGGCVTDLAAVDPGGPVQGTISGVAPGVNLHDYNVFPGFGGGYVAFGGSAFSHDIARALEDAVNDGMDVVNLSLGGTVQGPHDYLADAINATAAAGVVPVVAAGNSGPGASTVESPGNAVDALTVGATTNAHYVGVNVVTPGGTFGAAVGDFDPFAASPVTDAPFLNWNTADPLACVGSTPEADVTGAVVLISRGSCAFSDKVATAAAAGAIGVVMANNVGGDPIAMGGEGTIPAVMVSQEDGATLTASLPSTVTIDGSSPTEVLTDNADIMAGFSSRGPGPFLGNIKPDVVAPGVNIYSSVFDEAAPENLGWAMFQGTSMATPHVAGSAALLLAQNPDLDASDVKSLLGNNAERQVWADEVGGTLASVMERGGGRIDLERASAATTTFDPMSLSFGVTNGNKPVNKAITVTVTNLTDTAKTLSLSGGDANLSFPATVDLPASGTATFTVGLSVRGATTAEGDLTITDGNETFLVPFHYSTGN